MLKSDVVDIESLQIVRMHCVLVSLAVVHAACRGQARRSHFVGQASTGVMPHQNPWGCDNPVSTVNQSDLCQVDIRATKRAFALQLFGYRSLLRPTIILLDSHTVGETILTDRQP